MSWVGGVGDRIMPWHPGGFVLGQRATLLHAPGVFLNRVKTFRNEHTRGSPPSWGGAEEGPNYGMSKRNRKEANPEDEALVHDVVHTHRHGAPGASFGNNGMSFRGIRNPSCPKTQPRSQATHASMGRPIVPGMGHPH